MNRVSITLLTALIVAGAGWTAWSAEPATQPASQAADEAHWRDVVTRLGSDAYSERQAAQKELESLTYKQMDLLRQLAAGATDAEAKSRLMTRITQIEEEQAYSPPPISLEVQNATLADVADELSKSMGISLDAWPPKGSNGQAFWTLSVKEKPFWEVMIELQKEHGFSLQSNDTRLRLMQQDPGMPNAVVSGGLCIFPQSITRTRTVGLQDPPGNQVRAEQMSLSYMVALDPRVKISNSLAPELTKVVDDLGNVLYEQPADTGTVRWNNFGQPAHMWQQGTQLAIPKNLGKKIASAQGRLRLLVQLAADTVEVTEIEKKLNTPLKVGARTLTFQQFDPQPDHNSVRFQMQVTGGVRSGLPDDALNTANAPVTISFIDANGKYIWGQTIQGGSGGSFGGQFVPPLKVELSAPTKVKEVTIPFELKDLPLP